MPKAPEKKTKRRITESDWKTVAEFVKDEADRRASRSDRKTLENQWKEVDRQVAMEPRARVDAEGRAVDASTDWMPNLELSLQAETLEIHTSDVARFLFPDDRNFFSAHVGMDDSALEAMERATLVPGLSDASEQALRSFFGEQQQGINQENLDALIEGVLTHFHNMWGHRKAWDLISSETLKYGVCPPQANMVRLDQYSRDFRGVFRENRRIPALNVYSIKDVYLDDSETQAFQSGYMLGPSYIRRSSHNLDDLRLEASKGSQEPTLETGGWMPKRLENLEAKGPDKKSVEVLEYEGDLVVPRKTTSAMFFPNVIVSVVVSGGGPTVFRYREREFPFRRTIENHYHREHANSPYSTSPLIKGVPLQKAATDAMNRMMQAVALQAGRPMAWDPSDTYLEAQGGPALIPNSVFQALSKIQVIEVGDVGGLLNVYLALVRQYMDVTGVHAPRLGAQTKSHQTRFAVASEQERGAVRTVDYVRSMMTGSMQSWLSMEYYMLRKKMPPTDIFVPKYQAYVRVTRDMLPESVTFDVHGSAGPLEEREKFAQKQNALALALQIEPLKLQTGGKPLNLKKIQETLLREGGFTNVDTIMAEEVEPEAPGTQAGPGIPDASGGLGEGTPEDAIAQLAKLSGQR